MGGAGPSAPRRGAFGLAVWLLLALAAGFALPAWAESHRRNASPEMRQLAKPFTPQARVRAMRSRAARRAHPVFSPRRTPSAARAILASQLARGGRHRWRGYRSRLRAGAHERWPSDAERGARGRGPRKAALMRRPLLSREIAVDQLLAAPRADGDDRLPSLGAVGIPVFRDVPAIVIITQPRPERDRYGMPPRYRAR